jgi:glycosyltransferase involved in cell wall biosynthesis
MRVIHVPFGFFPDAAGGTEVYVQSLALALQERGVRVSVAAPGDRDADYVWGALPVRRFSVDNIGDLRDLYGSGDPRAAEVFGHIVDEQCPDLVHLHAFTRGVSLRLAREAKRRGIPVVFTYHTPTVSCQRGTLMRWGREVCDGVIHANRCTTCTLQAHGLPRPLAGVVGRAPIALGQAIGTLQQSVRVTTALRMREMIDLRHQSIRALLSEVDHVVAVCHWVQALLLRNGVPPEKVTVSRHGLSRPLDDVDQHPKALGPELPLRMAFLGRFVPAKGPDLLLRVLKMLPEAPVRLDLYGITEGAASSAYLQQLKAIAGNDARIRFLPPIANQGVISLLRGYHLLAVPSRGLETGPLVVLESFAAGVPVIGSKLGGIAELVRHDVNGLLVAPGATDGWRQAIQRLSQEPGLLPRLRSGIEPPRRMDDVADEMLALYRSLVPRVRQTAAAGSS